MKQIIKGILMLSILSIVLYSCKKDDVASELTVLETKVANGPLANTGTIQLSSTNFSATVEDEWCTIQTEGNVIHVSMDQNDSKTNRSTLIHITANDGKKLVVPITQRGLLFEVNSPLSNLNYSLKGGVKKINVISNIDYEVKFDQDWLSYEIVGDTLLLKANTFAPADLNERRTAKATLMYGNEEVVLELAQFNIFSYEDFMGAAFLSYVDHATLDESKRVRIPVTIKEKIPGTVFTVTTAPMAVLGNNRINIDVTYNPDASIQINSGQLIVRGLVEPKANDIINNNMVKVYAAAYNIAAKAFSTKADPLLKASGQSVGTGTQYKFEKFNEWDNGALLPSLLKYYTADGLAISAYRFSSVSMSRYSTIAPYVYMLDLRLEK